MTWEAPPAGQQNGEISGYKVTYSKADESTMRVINVGARERSVNIDNLETYTPYRVRVLAYTSVGEGPASPPEMTYTDEDGKTTTHLYSTSPTPPPPPPSQPVTPEKIFSFHFSFAAL